MAHRARVNARIENLVSEIHADENRADDNYGSHVKCGAKSDRRSGCHRASHHRCEHRQRNKNQGWLKWSYSATNQFGAATTITIDPSTWSGCVTDRDQNYDVQKHQPSGIDGHGNLIFLAAIILPEWAMSFPHPSGADRSSAPFYERR
jgi:hypothetical protein